MIVGQGKAITVTVITLVGIVLIATMAVLTVLARSAASDIDATVAASDHPAVPGDAPAGFSEMTRSTDPAAWITADDYPADALRRGEQGTVKFRAEIDRDGRVGRCAIVESSGSPSLDEATCRAITTRARFAPRKAEVPLTISRRVVWRLPE